MQQSRRMKLIIRWSILTAAAIALFWSAWRLAVGEVPVVTSVRLTPTWVVEFSFAVSRWWDILVGPIWSLLSVLLLSAGFNEHKDARGGVLIGLGFGLGFGLLFGLLFGLGLDLVSGLVVGLLIGLGFGTAIGFAHGFFVGLGFSLAYDLGFGLAVSLTVGLVFGLASGLVWGIAVVFICGLRKLFSHEVRQTLHRWFVAEGE